MSVTRIVIAMPPDLRERFFPATLWQQLTGLGTVTVIDRPADLSAPGARELLRAAGVLVTGWGTGRVDHGVLEAAPELRAIVHTAGSVRSVVSPECYQRGVSVSSQAAANAIPVAEYAVAMIVLAAKGVFRAQSEYRRRRAHFDVYRELPVQGIYRTAVGIVGASSTGRRTAELLRAYDFRVLLADPTIDSGQAAALGAELVPLAELMATCRVVSLHAPVLPNTVGMISAEVLALMMDGATFVNTARGVLVDQAALIRELQSGRLDAVLDVTDPEVGPVDSPLWDLPNVVLTPHIAGAIGVELHRLGESAVDEVGRWAAGLPFLHPVTAEAFDGLA